MRWDLCPWKEPKGEEKFLHPGKPSHWQNNQLGQKNEIQRLRGEGKDWFVVSRIKTYTDGPSHCPVQSNLGHTSSGKSRVQVLEYRVQRTDQGRGLLLAVWIQLKVTACGVPWPGMAAQKALAATEMKWHCWIDMWRKVWGQHYSLFAHVVACFHGFQVCLGRFIYSAWYLGSCPCTEVEPEITRGGVGGGHMT